MKKKSKYNPYGRGKATIPFKVKVKPRSVMGDNIALHGLLPKNELPKKLRGKIPENEIWMRKDVYDDPKRREQILQGHEKFELGLMETQGLTYKQAHSKAQIHEKTTYKIKKFLKKKLGLETELHDPVKVIDKK